jgi:hypothetical protein
MLKKHPFNFECGNKSRVNEVLGPLIPALNHKIDAITKASMFGILFSEGIYRNEVR